MGKLKLQLFAKSVEELAKEVIKGNYGNGDARKKALGSKYTEVQTVVNQMLNGTYKSPSTTTTKKTTTTAKNTTNKNASSTTTAKSTAPKVSGVDSSVMETINSTYKPSDELKKAETNKNNSANAYKEWASNTDIIDQSTWDDLNKQWQTPASVLKADKFLAGQREQIRSGRTSYTDKVEELFNNYMNREDFQYDVSEDQLFQQALASAMGSGKTAMQDTIGQASALTGGYGSTFATSAGNQAYNSFIEDAYNNLPEYYNMALQAYQMEGEEMLQQFNMAATLDAQEYGRLVESYNLGVEERNWQYNTAFNEWSTSVTNAYNSANLQLSENAQIGSNLYNTYAIDNDTYTTKYNQEYQSWMDRVTNATNIAGLQNSDYWNQTEFDENVRQYEEQFAYQKERDTVADNQWNQTFNYQKERDTVADNQWNQTFNYQKERDKVADNQWQQEYNLSASKASSGSGGSGSGSGTTKLSNGASASSMATYKQKAVEKYNKGGDDELDAYVDSLGLSETEKAEIGTYVYGDGKGQKGYGELPLEKRTFTKTKDTINWLWGIDNDDVVKDQYGNEYKISDLPKELQKELTKLKKNESYTYSGK